MGWGTEIDPWGDSPSLSSSLLWVTAGSYILVGLDGVPLDEVCHGLVDVVVFSLS